MITLHTIVKNEDRFIKAALVSVLAVKDVGRALVWDTGSIDRTVQEILSIKDSRIEFAQKGNVSRKQLVLLRNEQLRMTKTPWILLVDGDEIWPENNLRKLVSAMSRGSGSGSAGKQCGLETIALVNKTRNVVGDFYHYLPESKGHYRIGSWTGHLNIRAIRNLPGLTVKGEYPNEWYELNAKKIQDQPEKLEFVDTWYLHLTHMRRSSSWFAESLTIDRLKKHKWLGKFRKENLFVMKESELPKLSVS
ncbi:glycosyltransferase [Candidatus Collierbacteria bacterium]|nr:glycosyltransferase [Candidatus Collierbacteria bacterium]